MNWALKLALLAFPPLAQVRSELEQPEESLRLLQRALEVGAPPSPSAARETLTAQHDAGMVLMTLGRHEDAGLVFPSPVTRAMLTF